MAAFQNILYPTLFLALLICQGMSQQCGKETMTIEQMETGKIIKGKKEYQVIVINICECPQRNVTLDCDGFQTVAMPDPGLMKIVGTECILLEGRDIIPDTELDFNYAWDDDFGFMLTSATPICPPASY